MDAQRIETIFVGVGSVAAGGLFLLDPAHMPPGLRSMAARLGRYRRVAAVVAIAAGVLILVGQA